MADDVLGPADFQSAPDAKVAIPRLRRPDYHVAATTRTRRVADEIAAVACTQCRKRKIKCSGDRPRCTLCEKQDIECHYDQERKHRLRDARQRNHALTTLLNDISVHLDETNKRKVEHVLKTLDDGASPPATPAMSIQPSGKRPRTGSWSDMPDNRSLFSADAGEEAEIAASVGSNEELDLLEEDLLQSKETSMTGYMGRNSQLHWLRALEEKLEMPGETGRPHGPPGVSSKAFEKRAETLHRRRTSATAGYFTGYNFYLDDSDIFVDIEDPDIVPSLETAEQLFRFYQLAVHNPFRILDDGFGAQLQTYYEAVQGGKLNVDTTWKAILNLVFAIGARYSHLIGADWGADDRDHLVYLWRAIHQLELKTTMAFISAPDLSIIQATGLLSFYFLVIGHVSKAWYMIGFSLRHAQAAGLHLRQEDPTVALSRKIALARTWWGLYSLESAITSITGRPRVVARQECTVPQPGDISDGKKEMTTHTHTPSGSKRQLDRAASGPSSAARQLPPQVGTDLDSFTDTYIELDRLMHEILDSLYSPRHAARSWQDMQKEISSFLKQLEGWALQALPHGPFGAASTSEPDLSRQQLLLYFYYNNAKICITRPCLCRLDQRIKGQSEESANFNKKSAKVCVQAALDITSLLPEPPNPRWFYEKGPWWETAHIIMQALTVLLLESTQGNVRLAIDKSQINPCVGKLIRWLQSMMDKDSVSERAYSIVRKILDKQNPASHANKPAQSAQMAGSMQGQQQHQHGEQAFAPNVASHANMNPLAQSLEGLWPNNDIESNADLYSSDMAGNFEPQYTSDYLNDPLADFQFGQPQMPLFYGDPYSTNFDQSMGSFVPEFNSWTGLEQQQWSDPQWPDQQEQNPQQQNQQQ